MTYRKYIAMGLVTLGIWACLDRKYGNPFISETGSEISLNWKRDMDGNGIADSVEFYAWNCNLSPAECLHLAQVNAIAIKFEDSLPKIPTPAIPPKDTIAVVKQAPILNIPVRVATVSAPDLTIREGQKVTPVITILPSNATNKAYSLTCDNPEIASLRGNEITGVKKGFAKITITAADGGITGSFTIKVDNSRSRD